MAEAEVKFPSLDEFHAHLDVCKQCEENPFEKCKIGAVLIEKAAAEVTERGKLVLPDWTRRAFDGEGDGESGDG